MKRIVISILTLMVLLPAVAQNDAETLLRNTVNRLEKDFGISATLKVEITGENGTDRQDVALKISSRGFCAVQDEMTLWYDGKTIWRGNDFGDGIEEIYISEPTPEEKARYDIVGLLRQHKGFILSGGKESFTLTASNAERSIEGIARVTVTVHPTTYVMRNVVIDFAQELGDIKANVEITDYKSGLQFDVATFQCPVKEYQDADIIDLR